jgi:glycosyltransferase involved in cell wall biosynthesis
MNEPHGQLTITSNEYEFAVEGGREATVTITASIPHEFLTDPDHEKAAVAIVGFRDSEGHDMLPITELTTSPGIGPYVYLRVGAAGPSTKLTLNCPNGAASITIILRSWRAHIPVSLTSIDVAQSKDRILSNYDLVASKLKDLPRSTPIYIIYTTAPEMGHPAIKLRSNRFALELADRGNFVIFFPFGGVTKDNVLFSDRIVQLKRDGLGDTLDAISADQRVDVTFICSAFSDHQATCAIDLANLYGWKTLYECRDDMEEFKRSGYAKWHFPRLEMRAASTCQHVTAVSPRLQQKMREIARDRVVHLIPNAVSDEFLVKTTNERSLHRLNSRARSKTIGYIGHLTSSWFDWPLIVRSAHQSSDLLYEFIGFGEPKHLQLPKNIKLLGSKNHDEFIEISRSWAIGIIPFIPSKLTYGVDPNKLYEYLALGIPVVSASMGGVATSPLTDVYERVEDYDNLIRKRLGRKYTAGDIRVLDAYLEKCRWPTRISDTLKLLGAPA